MQRLLRNKQGKYCIVSTASTSMPSLFLLVLVLLLLLLFYLSSHVFTGVSERYQDNGRDQRLRRSNSRQGENGYVFCPFLFFFSPFLLLTLLLDYLIFREVGSVWQHGKQKRFNRGHGGRLQIICALLMRSGGNGMCSDILCFLVSSSHCSYFPTISFFAKISNRRAGAGSDRTDADGDRNVSKTGGGKGYVSSCLFYLLKSFLLLALLLF